MKIMKNKLILLVLALVSFCMSCEEDLLIYNPDSNFIQISDVTALTVLEDGGMAVETTFGLALPSDTDVSVSFMISSADDTRYDVSVPLTNGIGTITIPAGETSASVGITPIDNFAVDGGVDITVSISESSDLPIGLAGEGLERISRSISIADNDCPIDINAFVGTFAVEEVITGGPNTGLALAAAFGEFYQLDLALDPTDASGTRLIINNNGNEFIPDGTALSFLTCPGNVALDPSPTLIALFTTFTITSSSYSEDNPVITVDGNLGASRTYQFILTRL